MAVKDETNAAYLALIALAEKGLVRKAMIAGRHIYFASRESLEALGALGINPVEAKASIKKQLATNGFYDCSDYSMTFRSKDVRVAIEQAEPKKSSNGYLVLSVEVNTADLPYTQKTQQEVDARKLMLR